MFIPGMWKRKLEAEAVEADNFLWKRKHFDERVGSGSELGSKRVETEPEAEAVFFKIRRFRIFSLATTVGVKCYNNNNNNNIESTTRSWYGMEWKMEWNGNFGMEYGRCQNGMEWKISRMIWKTIFHTSIPISH